MKQSLRILICLLVVGLLPGGTLGGAVDADPLQVQQKEGRKVQQLLFERRYEAAESKIREAVLRWPDDIIGYVGMMMLYQLQNFENFDGRFDEAYLRWHEQGRKRALQIIKNGDSDPWHLFLASGAMGLSGLHRLNKHQIVRAIRDGSMAINALKKARRKDSSWADPLFGLGMYDYWRSVFTNRWKFLPIFPDKRRDGIDQLKTVMEQGEYATDLAQGSLAFMYYNEKKYDVALSLCKPLSKKYPNNVILRALYAHILLKRQDFERARKEYMRVLNKYPDLTKFNYYMARLSFREVEARQKAASKKDTELSQQVIADYEEVIRWVERYLAAEPSAKDYWKGQAYLLWAEALYQMQRWQESQAKYRLALKHDYSLYHAKKRRDELAKRAMTTDQ